MAAHTYVALGDSISIDDYSGGPGRGGASLLFRNRDDDFPTWRGRDLATMWPGSRLQLLASDGATTRTVLDRQLARLRHLSEPADLVTLTIGGNDLLAGYGDTRSARRIIQGVRDDVARILDQLAPLVAPHGRTVVGTVYDPSDGTGDSTRLGLPPWPDGVAVLGELNDTLRTLAAESGAAVAEIAQRFMGHGVTAGHPGQPSARPASRELWYCNVIEPNAWGADGVRAAFWEAAGVAARDAESPVST